MTTQLPKLPSRYEDLDTAFRGRLRPVPDLNALVQQAFKSMLVSGGIRFLPLFGHSGTGKTSAALELATHTPDVGVFVLSRAEIERTSELAEIVSGYHQKNTGKKLLVLVVDQFEEAVEGQAALATSFVEQLALLDRSPVGKAPLLVLWLTTKREFQNILSDATSRNSRILVARDFEITGPQRADWPTIIEDTFSFHNHETPLAEFDVLQEDITSICENKKTIGTALEAVGARVAAEQPGLHDLSEYQIIMLWPVTDGQRIGHIQRFTDPRSGYRLDWNTWFRQLNADDQRQLASALHGFNKARLYFDLRVVPIAAADLKDICVDLENPDHEISRTALGKFERTHFHYLVSGNWDPQTYSPMRERESDRADEAREWYGSVTRVPTKIGSRIAKALSATGIPAKPEQEISTIHSTVRADVLAERPHNAPPQQPKIIVELKAFGPERTMPSTICEQIKITLRRHAQLAGFLPRQ